MPLNCEPCAVCPLCGSHPDTKSVLLANKKKGPLCGRVGSALHSHCRGREFESLQVHHKSREIDDFTAFLLLFREIPGPAKVENLHPAQAGVRSVRISFSAAEKAAKIISQNAASRSFDVVSQMPGRCELDNLSHCATPDFLAVSLNFIQSFAMSSFRLTDNRMPVKIKLKTV